MRAVSLLKHALSKEPKRVLDLGVGNGEHAKAFISYGADVVGIDVRERPHTHPKYTHIKSPIELLDQGEDEEKYDLIWCSHILEHMPNVQYILVKLAGWLKDDGWLYIAVPTDTQERVHIGHLTLWTPALLIYNLICAGWDCKEAEWYTSYRTIGLCVKKKRIEDMSWRTGSPDEIYDVNKYSPRVFHHEWGAWWENNWPEELPGRCTDPPLVTINVLQTNLPPRVQMNFGPNPSFRREPGPNWR